MEEEVGGDKGYICRRIRRVLDNLVDLMEKHEEICKEYPLTNLCRKANMLSITTDLLDLYSNLACAVDFPELDRKMKETRERLWRALHKYKE